MTEKTHHIDPAAVSLATVAAPIFAALVARRVNQAKARVAALEDAAKLIGAANALIATHD